MQGIRVKRKNTVKDDNNTVKDDNIHLEASNRTRKKEKKNGGSIGNRPITSMSETITKIRVCCVRTKDYDRHLYIVVKKN